MDSEHTAKSQIIYEIQTIFLPWLLQVVLECYIDPVDIENAAKQSIQMDYPQLGREKILDLKRAVRQKKLWGHGCYSFDFVDKVN